MGSIARYLSLLAVAFGLLLGPSVARAETQAGPSVANAKDSLGDSDVHRLDAPLSALEVAEMAELVSFGAEEDTDDSDFLALRSRCGLFATSIECAVATIFVETSTSSAHHRIHGARAPPAS